MIRKILKVRWEDSCGHSGWVEEKEAKDKYKPSEIMTVGFQVKKDRNRLVMALNHDDYDQIGDTITIPRKCIKEIEVIGRA